MANVPIYVTRKSGAGETGDFTLSRGLALAVFLLVLLNVVGWSIFGLVILIEKVVSLLG